MEPTRQIHLDFHTSEHIPGIGSQFDKKQFQEALQLGRINLINLFAKCHHSWSYYPTIIGMPHPQLVCSDLLGNQIEACHEIGVKAPIYFTMGWSAMDAELHPEWCVKNKDGSILTSQVSWPDKIDPEGVIPGFQWKSLCPSGDYHDLMMAQTEEILKTYEVDGMWYDIYQAQHPCWCPNCLKEMKKDGTDINNIDEVVKFRSHTFSRHMKAIKKLILDHHSQASVYFNGITSLERSENLKYRLFEINTKNDLEDLPTTWGGYDKFPIRSKLFHRENKDVVAMSGKFHTAWGEFGGFKDPEAIRFEAASMIAYGASCNFGDQLHPSGIMDMTTYANIGHGYKYVEAIEEYGVGGLPCADLGMWMVNDSQADEGLVKMLLEEQRDFDLVLSGDDLNRFDTIIVPSLAGILDERNEDVNKYLAQGGKLIVIGEGLLNKDKSAASIKEAGTYLGAPLFDMDFTQVSEDLALSAKEKSGPALTGRLASLPHTPFLNYQGAIRFKPDSSAQILAKVYEPYFSRTWGKYCGHQNTPNKTEPASYPALWQKGGLICIAHNLDRMYYHDGAKAHRSLFKAVLNRLHTSPMANAALPSAGRISLLHQGKENRYVLHLLYGAPIQRGRCSVIEDLPELRDVEVVLRLPTQVKKLTLIPDGKELSFKEELSDKEGFHTIKAVIPAFSCHCALVADY